VELKLGKGSFLAPAPEWGWLREPAGVLGLVQHGSCRGGGLGGGKEMEWWR
jgi:hypothetical protein